MADGHTSSTMQRKLASARDGTRAGERTALKALRRAFAQAADEVLGMPLTVIGVTQTWIDLDSATGYLGDQQLLLVLDGTDGRIGAIGLDAATVAAIVQQQTMGRMGTAPQAARPFTGTDAALTAPLVDAALARAAELAEPGADRNALAGFRFGARAEDVRSLLLTFSAPRLRAFGLTFDLGQGVKPGQACLILPEAPSPAASAEAARGAGSPDPGLGRVVGTMRAELCAVVARLRIPLAELGRMEPGDVIPLQSGRLDDTALLAINGAKIASGRLGQSGGFRALRLNETADAPAQGPMPEDMTFFPRLGSTPSEISDELRPLGRRRPAAEPAKAQSAEDADHEDDVISRMSPEEAAAEISQLAGLDLAEEERADQAIRAPVAVR